MGVACYSERIRTESKQGGRVDNAVRADKTGENVA